MQTECSPTLFEFEPVERHKVVAGFDGGIICASHLSHPGCIKNADRSAGTGDGTIFAVRRA